MRPRDYCALPCHVRVLYVYVQAGEHLLPDTGVTDHNYRIANLKFRGSLRAVISGRIEYLSNKLNQTSGVRNDNPWSNGMPTIGFESGWTSRLGHDRYSVVLGRRAAVPGPYGAIGPRIALKRTS